jgi:PKHD-type hydroxylase|tara:strand:+ start:1856 stop:2494 length:639 start_codon:yes stop_codon:yes gene_type:complete
MNLKDYYWYFDSVLPHKFCDELIKYGNTKKEELGLIGEISEKNASGKSLEDRDFQDLKKKRDSNVVWLSDRWIYREIHPYVHEANKNSQWNFEWDFSEACQFTKYKLNQYYDWHCDSWEKPYANDNGNINYRNKIRKLSVTCQLSDSSEYEGGELEFQYRNKDNPNMVAPCEQAKKKGSIIVFPSFVWHRVKPVTKGTRYSLVIWNLGKPFR